MAPLGDPPQSAWRAAGPLDLGAATNAPLDGTVRAVAGTTPGDDPAVRDPHTEPISRRPRDAEGLLELTKEASTRQNRRKPTPRCEVSQDKHGGRARIRPSKLGADNTRSASSRGPETGRVGPRRGPEDRWRARRRWSAPPRRAAPHAPAPAVDHVDAIAVRARYGVTRRRGHGTQRHRGAGDNQRGQPERHAAAAGAHGPPPSWAAGLADRNRSSRNQRRQTGRVVRTGFRGRTRSRPRLAGRSHTDVPLRGRRRSTLRNVLSASIDTDVSARNERRIGTLLPRRAAGQRTILDGFARHLLEHEAAQRVAGHAEPRGLEVEAPGDGRP